MKLSSFWLEGVEAKVENDQFPQADVDVAIVGSGYTGLSAALTLAEAGRSVVVFEKGDIGAGCSTRNGGQLSHSIKPTLAQLSAKYGPERATAIRQEGPNALNWLADLVETRALDCDFRRCGRFHAAHSPAAYDAMARDAEDQRREGVEVHVVPRDEQFREIGSGMFFGGVVNPTYASIHPAKYHRALLRLARDAGATVIGHCAVTGLAREGAAHEVTTTQGRIRAHDMIVAANGYTMDVTRWLQRRVIPVGSYIIATEPLDRDILAACIPTGRNITESSDVVYYYRLSPDGRRLIFGGRVSAFETDGRKTAPRLYLDMVERFPVLEGVGLSHSWHGTVAYTFDNMLHVGERDGVHFALGYCGSGVALSGYLGDKLARKVLGRKDGATGFDNLPFDGRPFYRGRPWFLPVAVGYYRFKDRVTRRHSLRKAR